MFEREEDGWCALCQADELNRELMVGQSWGPWGERLICAVAQQRLAELLAMPLTILNVLAVQDYRLMMERGMPGAERFGGSVLLDEDLLALLTDLLHE